MIYDSDIYDSSFNEKKKSEVQKLMLALIPLRINDIQWIVVKHFQHNSLHSTTFEVKKE